MTSTMKRWLVMTDVDAIQPWLLASAHLRGIAGASQLLVDYDAEDSGLAKGGVALFSAGGSAVAMFNSDEDAKVFVREARKRLRERTVSARLSTSEPVPFDYPTGFGDARLKAAASLEVRKRQGQSEEETADAPFARRCQGCGTEPARQEVSVGTDLRWLGAACLKREDERDRASWLAELHFPNGRKPRLSRDFDELAGKASADGRGDIAIVAADVNGVGERLRQLCTDTEYQAFSKGLKEAVSKACYAALAEVIGNATKLPVELIYMGGDDLLVVCRGSLALPFARRLVFKFAELTKAASKEDGDWTGGTQLGMSAAVVLVRVGFPFRVAYDIAERLLAEAKREARAKGWENGAVDFVRITEANGGARAVLADRALKSPGGADALYLTGRPFNAVETGERSLGGFEAACKHLVQEFPRSKLFDLRERCSASVYLIPGGFLTDTITPETVAGARAKLVGFLDYWRSRLERNPEAEARWRAACGKVGIPHDSVMWQENQTSRTPAGDFAEGIDLWGL